MSFRDDFIDLFLSNGISRAQLRNMSDLEFQNKLNSFLDDNYASFQQQTPLSGQMHSLYTRQADIDGFGNGNMNEDEALKAAIEASLDDMLIAPHLRPPPDPRNEIVHDDVSNRRGSRKRTNIGGVPKNLQPKPTPLPRTNHETRVKAAPVADYEYMHPPKINLSKKKPAIKKKAEEPAPISRPFDHPKIALPRMNEVPNRRVHSKAEEKNAIPSYLHKKTTVAKKKNPGNNDFDSYLFNKPMATHENKKLPANEHRHIVKEPAYPVYGHAHLVSDQITSKERIPSSRDRISSRERVTATKDRIPSTRDRISSRNRVTPTNERIPSSRDRSSATKERIPSTRDRISSRNRVTPTNERISSSRDRSSATKEGIPSTRDRISSRNRVTPTNERIPSSRDRTSSKGKIAKPLRELDPMANEYAPVDLQDLEEFVPSVLEHKPEPAKPFYNIDARLPDLPTIDDLPKITHDEFDINDEEPKVEEKKEINPLRQSHNERAFQDYEYMQILQEEEQKEKEREEKERIEEEKKLAEEQKEVNKQEEVERAFAKIPPEPAKGVTVAVILFSKRIIRKFNPDELGKNVYAWIAKQSEGKLFLDTFELAPVGGQKLDLNQSLEDQGIKGRVMLMITDCE